MGPAIVGIAEANLFRYDHELKIGIVGLRLKPIQEDIKLLRP